MRNILIIGNSRGIGASLCCLAGAEFQIYSISRSLPIDVHTMHFICDVFSAPLPILAEPLAGLVYCPGCIQLKPFTSIKLEEIRHDLKNLYYEYHLILMFF
jgi:hypothetical protein